MKSDYTEAEMQRVRAEIVELRPRQKPKGAGRKRKLAGTSNRPKRDRRELKDNRSAEGRPGRRSGRRGPS